MSADLPLLYNLLLKGDSMPPRTNAEQAAVPPDSLFEALCQSGCVDNPNALYDWLFDDDRFEAWDTKTRSSFTRKVMQLQGLDKNHFRTMPRYAAYPPDTEYPAHPIVLIRGKVKGIDFVRHIRNGFGHRRNGELYETDGKVFIRLLDYDPDGAQSAFIAMPAKYLQNVFDMYVETEAKRKG